MPDNHADVIAAIHVIEHFYVWEVPAVLSEWQRILKPGGVLILELPDMQKVAKYLKACLDEGKPFWAQMSWWAMWGDPRYQDPAMCHKWGYTKPMMKETLRDAGFVEIEMSEPRYHLKQRDMRVTARKGSL